MFVGKYVANRSVTAQAVRGLTKQTGLYDYNQSNRRLAPRSSCIKKTKNYLFFLF
jgi:hypothetical protein